MASEGRRGMESARVEEIANRLRDHAQSLDRARAHVDAAVRALRGQWTGGDARRFFVGASSIDESLRSASTAVHGMSRSLLAELREQDLASAGGGGPTGPLTDTTGQGANHPGALDPPTRHAWGTGSGTDAHGLAGWKAEADDAPPWPPTDIFPPDFRGIEDPEARREAAEAWCEDNLDGMTDEQLAAFMLSNPGAPDEVVDWVRENRPEAFGLFLSGIRQGLAGNLPWGMGGAFNALCAEDAGGVVIGPDGYSYAVWVPAGDEPPEGATWWDPIADDGGGGSWVTVGVAHGNVPIGEPIPTWIALIPGFQMPGYLDLLPHAITSDPNSMFVYDPATGEVVAVQGGSAAGPGVPEFPESADVPDPFDTSGVAVAEGSLELALGAAANLEEIDGLNNDRWWATELVYQEDAETGERRVVAVFRQIRATPDNEVVVVTAFGMVTPDGEVVPVHPGPGSEDSGDSDD